jgi:DNA-damage-inducible protein J
VATSSKIVGGRFSVVRARIDEQVKEEASAVLASMGLTVSDAFRLLLTRVAREKALPFEPLVPNARTIAAMKEARRGGLASFKSANDLMADLNADDRTVLANALDRIAALEREWEELGRAFRWLHDRIGGTPPDSQ